MTKQLQNLADILEKRVLDCEVINDYWLGRLNESEYILKIVNLMMRDSTQSQ